MTAPSPPVNISEEIQAELLQRICFLDYRPGDQLKEAYLAKEFGVSRTPVRDAISRISHLGLVETRNGVGTVVRQLSLTEITHVYNMRLELAPMIGMLNPRQIAPSDRKVCERLLGQAADLNDAFDARGYVQLNHRLHEFIAGLIGNDVLRSFWWQTYYQAASTWYQLAHLQGPKAATALVSELTDIRDALDHNDLRALGYVQRIHIGYGFEQIKTLLF